MVFSKGGCLLSKHILAVDLARDHDLGTIGKQPFAVIHVECSMRDRKRSGELELLCMC
jgi:hypothetical protein